MVLTHKDISPKMKRIRLVSVICLFFYSCALLALSLTAYFELGENVTFLLDIITNWKANTIADIEIATDGACSSGFELAYEYYWPGTTEGCDCTTAVDQEFVDIGVQTKGCNDTELNYGCTYIEAYYKEELRNWGTINTASKGICLKRTKENWAVLGPSQGTSCPSGTRKCGDSENNIFCTKESSCPISGVTIESSSCADCYQIADAKYIKVHRNQDRLPLVEFRVNEYGMYYVANQSCKNPNREYFSMLKDPGIECNDEGTALWDKIDTTTEDLLFDANNIDSTITYLNNYGYYKAGTDGSDFEYSLYSRGYISWKMSCRGQMSDLIDKSLSLSFIQTAHLILMIVGIVAFAILILYLTFAECFNLFGCDDLPCFSGREEDERKSILVLRGLVLFFIQTCVLTFELFAIITLLLTKGLIEEVASNNCSYTKINELITNTSDSLQSTFLCDVSNVAVFGLFSLLALIGIKKQLTLQQHDDELRKKKTAIDDDLSRSHVNDLSISNQVQYQNQNNYGPYIPQQPMPLLQAQYQPNPKVYQQLNQQSPLNPLNPTIPISRPASRNEIIIQLPGQPEALIGSNTIQKSPVKKSLSRVVTPEKKSRIVPIQENQ